MEILDLPNELILAFGEWADPPALSALASTSRRLHSLLNPLLYRRNAKEQHSAALIWAAANGRVDTAKLCLSYWADINTALALKEESQEIIQNRGHHFIMQYGMAMTISLIFSKNRLETMINSVAFDGNTPLHFLAIMGPPDSAGLLDRLLSLDPDLNVPNNDLLRPIDCFVDEGNLHAARRLFQLGSRPYQLYRCIISACKKSLPRCDLPSGYKRQWVQERNDLVLSLIYHALEIGQLTRDVGENRRVSALWFGIFQIACVHPPLLRELLRDGFRPDLLTGEYSMLLKLVETLESERMPDHFRRSLLEAIRMLTRADDRWDRKGPRRKTALDYLVRDSDSVAPELRAALFKSLLGSRPPEQTGAEQAHLNQLAQYALGNRKMEIYGHLIRHGAKDLPGYRAPEQTNGGNATERQGLVALQWFKPDLKVVTANRLGMALGRSV
ncbi:hypothetical protein LA080_006628 [Diaporthe eres]|nr:hypothetical protein LA080_006628 [Diaporthe eres]